MGRTLPGSSATGADNGVSRDLIDLRRHLMLRSAAALRDKHLHASFGRFGPRRPVVVGQKTLGDIDLGRKDCSRRPILAFENSEREEFLRGGSTLRGFPEDALIHFLRKPQSLKLEGFERQLFPQI